VSGSGGFAQMIMGVFRFVGRRRRRPHVAHGRAPMMRGGMLRTLARSARRIGVVTIMAIVLSTLTPPDPSDSPGLSGLWSWLGPATASAQEPDLPDAGDIATPEPADGAAPDAGIQVPAEATRADTGTGRAVIAEPGTVEP
jgi:hypothetical protein